MCGVYVCARVCVCICVCMYVRICNGCSEYNRIQYKMRYAGEADSIEKRTYRHLSDIRTWRRSSCLYITLSDKFDVFWTSKYSISILYSLNSSVISNFFHEILTKFLTQTSTTHQPYTIPSGSIQFVDVPNSPKIRKLSKYLRCVCFVVLFGFGLLYRQMVHGWMLQRKV